MKMTRKPTLKTLLLGLALFVPAMALTHLPSQVPLNGFQIVQQAITRLANGSDLSSINGWFAHALRQDGSQTFFRVPCTRETFLYRNSRSGRGDGDPDAFPEFDPHVIPAVLAQQIRPGASIIRSREPILENGKLRYEVIEIRPLSEGPGDREYAPLQLWYFDTQTSLPSRIDFVSEAASATLSASDYRPSHDDGPLVPFSASFRSKRGEDTVYRYKTIHLKRNTSPYCVK
jgi:hypothetical protein